MNEKIKILNMLENGDITADEASKLLSAIEQSEPQMQNNNNSNNYNNTSRHNIDFSKIANKIGKVTEKVAKKTVEIYGEVEKEVKGFIKSRQSASNKMSYSKEFNFSLIEYENDLEIKGLNGEIVLKGYNGDKLTIRAVYIPKIQDAKIDFYTPSSKNYMFLFNDEEFEKVSIEALIPKKYFKKLSIGAKNCNFSVDNIDFEDIEAKTSDSNGILENCNGKKANIDNINGKLIIRDINFEILKVCNINDYIKLNNIDVEKLDVDILNGEINLSNEVLNNYESYDWKIETQNHNINIEINASNIEYDLKARTSLGQINILKNNLKYLERSEGFVIAKSEDTISYFKKLNLDLKTSNSTITIK